mgnify:CR=1 FL=1
MKYGLIPELVGRLPVITVLEELNEEALIEILTKPKMPLLRQYQVLFAMEDVDIEFTPEALKPLHIRRLSAKWAPAACDRLLRRCSLTRC